jgi:hypothetical protein
LTCTPARLTSGTGRITACGRCGHGARDSIIVAARPQAPRAVSYASKYSPKYFLRITTQAVRRVFAWHRRRACACRKRNDRTRKRPAATTCQAIAIRSRDA